jgi:hypothetical protein
MMRRLWAWIKEEWDAPYGRCSKHNEPKTRFFGCETCCKERWAEATRLDKEAADLEFLRKSRMFVEVLREYGLGGNE